MVQPDQFCPYRGLQPYTEEDHEYFFGREEDQETISANLLTAPLTILYGASGVGKSSVLAAGVVPFLRKQSNVTVVVFRTWQDRTFLSSLKTEIQRVLKERFDQSFHSTTEISLDELLSQAVHTTRGLITIILDQFEEYFLYHPEMESNNYFDVEFARAVNRSEIEVHFLLAIREDSLSYLDRFQGRIPNLFGNYLRLEHLDRQAADRAIRRPLEKYNKLRVVSDAQITIQNSLVGKLIDDVQTGRMSIGQVGQGQLRTNEEQKNRKDKERIRIETPFLQMVLTRLWNEEMNIGSRELQLSTLERLGGAEQIVRTHLDAAMNELPKNEQEIAGRIFHHLVTPSGAKIAHTIPDLAEYTKLEATMISPILEKLSSTTIRILRPIAPPERQTTTRYEIFHDVLTPAILDWRRRYVERKTQEQTRLEEWQKRKRVLLKFSLLVLVSSLFAFGLLALFAFKQKKEADELRQIANARELAVNAIANLNVDTERSLLLAIHSINLRYTYEGEDALRQALSASPFRFTIRGHTNFVNSATFSHNSKLIVTASSDCTTAIWDAAVGHKLKNLRGHKNVVRWAVFSPDDSSIATASDDNTARIWSLATCQELVRFRHQGVISSIAYSPDGKKIITASGDKTARIWDAKTGQELMVLRGHKNWVRNAFYSPDSKYIVTASADKTAKIWDANIGAELKTLSGHQGIVLTASFSSNGKTIVTSSEDRTIRIWSVADISNIPEPRILRGHTHWVGGAIFSPNGKYLVTASDDSTARVWDLESGLAVVILRGHKGNVNSVAYSPDGNRIVTTSTDSTAKIWGASKGGELATLSYTNLTTISNPNSEGMWSAAYSPDGNMIVTANKNNTAKVWDVNTEQGLTVLRGHKGIVRSAVYSPDGNQIVTSSEDNTTCIWDAKKGARLAILSGHTRTINSAEYSPDGKRIVTASADKTARIWDVMKKRELLTLRGHTDWVRSASYSPDGKQIVTASGDGTARIWDAKTGVQQKVLLGHNKGLLSAKFSPTNRTIVTASLDLTVGTWDLITVKEPLFLRGHTNAVWNANYSSDSTLIVTASDDGTIRIWSTKTGSELSILRGHTNSVKSAVFSPDGNKIVSASFDGTAQINLVRINDLLNLAQKRLTRTLTSAERRKYLYEK